MRPPKYSRSWSKHNITDEEKRVYDSNSDTMHRSAKAERSEEDRATKTESSRRRRGMVDMGRMFFLN